MIKFSIGTLDENTLPGVMKIENEAFKEPWSENSFRRDMNNDFAKYTVLSAENSVVAYGGFWLSGTDAYITNIAVKRELRGQGLGKALVTSLLENARSFGAAAVTLEVRVSNSAAIALYKGAGFESCGVRPHFYPDGEDAFIMWLNL